MKLLGRDKKRLRTKYGQWVLITGASSGIGKELAIRCAECGLNVLINARNEKELTGLSDWIKLKYKVEVMIFAADLSDTQNIYSLLDYSEKLNIGLYIACAGYGTSGLFTDTLIGYEVDMIRVNIEALLIMTHHFAKRFADRKRGGIILMSSMVAFQGVPYSANYGATKAYVQSLSEALREELKPLGVDVLAAAPGPVNSGFGKRANMNMNMSLEPSDIGIPILKALGKKTTVLPGRLTKLLVYALRTVPRWAKVKIMKKVMMGFTRHQYRNHPG